jgi:hypothetical protein
VVKHVDAFELRIFIASALAAAADAELIARFLPIPGARLATALPRRHVQNLARRMTKKQPGGGEHAGEKGRGGRGGDT